MFPSPSWAFHLFKIWVRLVLFCHDFCVPKANKAFGGDKDPDKTMTDSYPNPGLKPRANHISLLRIFFLIILLCVRARSWAFHQNKSIWICACYCKYLFKTFQTFCATILCPSSLGCLRSLRLREGFPATPSNKNGMYPVLCFSANSIKMEENSLI